MGASKYVPYRRNGQWYVVPAEDVKSLNKGVEPKGFAWGPVYKSERLAQAACSPDQGRVTLTESEKKQLIEAKKSKWGK